MVEVSIVMPVFNGEKYLNQSIESVINQTFKNWELIIVNDCSTDNTLMIANKYASLDMRIKIISNEENKRLPYSLNVGFKNAKGKYFTWTSDDNIYGEEAISTMYNFMKNNGEYGLVYCDMYFIDEFNNKIGSVSKEVSELYYNDCIGACFMYRCEVLKTIGEYNTKKFLVEDYEYWLRINEKYPIYHINKIEYYYRIHNNSLTSTRVNKINEQLYKLRMEKLDFLLKRITSSEKELLFIDMWCQYSDVNLIRKFFRRGEIPDKIKWLGSDRHMDERKRIILFGAGDFGRKSLEFFGKDKIEFFVDNNEEKINTYIDGIRVIAFKDMLDIYENYNIVISVDARKASNLANQLIDNGIYNFKTYMELANNLKNPSLRQRNNLIEAFNKAVDWIKINTVKNEGIINNTNLKKSYPEVTGYYIPTLMKWGFRDIALDYTKWLCSIQKDDGSWYDTNNKEPYVFDSAQILKGLLSVRNMYPEVDYNIKKGCDWILSNMQNDGRLITPSKELWDESQCSELIHLYCLSPLIEAGKQLKINSYRQAAEKIAKYYINNYKEEILDFNILSHFYAYIMEALCDIGMKELAKEAMEKVAGIQREDGMVPAYKDVNWVCSTGLFQFAIVWYKLGEIERGNKALDYAIRLQNNSGGWYGSYTTIDTLKDMDIKEYPTYFETSEISWAVKYFLDALYYKFKLEFEIQSNIFKEEIDKNDGRYITILNEIKNCEAKFVCDVGCGKGRYIKNIIEDIEDIKIHCVDLSENVMRKIDGKVEKKQGSLTEIPYSDNFFDVVYSVEALEHAIATKNAVKEMIRVTKKNGKVVVIDKNKSSMGILEIDEWEQWFDDEFFKQIALETNCTLKIIKNISYENNIADNLFDCWILNKYGDK
ncbi:glycosyltransferase [Clostridium butyricum]|uniref:glycosyltransferase n=1 Tax=Clostridium butyricum TaxID=1492 RepID=UPI001CA9C04D|nr:glycosyltransferase [Clostridium butyricum]MBZ0312898.1 glycosyltransferase [Clostridium butyricum]